METIGVIIANEIKKKRVVLGRPGSLNVCMRMSGKARPAAALVDGVCELGERVGGLAAGQPPGDVPVANIPSLKLLHGLDSQSRGGQQVPPRSETQFEG